MRLVSYRHGGRDTFGRMVGDAVLDCAKFGPASVREVLEQDGLAALDAATGDLGADVALADVELLPVVPDPGKILCVGLNYRAHADEAGRDATRRPTVFTRFADSQIGAGQPVVIPPGVTQFDYEGELAVVIGRGGSRIAEADAMAHVAGYSCYDDLTARDWQGHSGQWTPGKNFAGTGAFGPALVTADEVGDLDAVHLQTRVDGEVRQSALLADLVFGIPELIAYLSSFTRLSPGDVIVTGTPGGVGLFRDPPTFLTGGETVEVEISGIGLLRNRVVAGGEGN